VRYFKNGLNGFTRVIYKNKHYYEGNMKNGKWYGEGKYVYANGTVKAGDWEDGILVKKNEVIKEAIMK